MESLIIQFESLKMQMLAFEASLKNMIPPSLPDPNNIIDPVEAAKAKARAEIQERTDARVAELRSAADLSKQMYLAGLFVDNRTEVKRLINSSYYESWHSPARRQLALIEAEISRIEGERTMKRRRQFAERKRFATPPSKFASACAAVRAAHPTLSKGEVYLQARMRLKMKACASGLAALNNK